MGESSANLIQYNETNFLLDVLLLLTFNERCDPLDVIFYAEVVRHFMWKKVFSRISSKNSMRSGWSLSQVNEDTSGILMQTNRKEFSISYFENISISHLTGVHLLHIAGM